MTLTPATRKPRHRAPEPVPGREPRRRSPKPTPWLPTQAPCQKRLWSPATFSGVLEAWGPTLSRDTGNQEHFVPHKVEACVRTSENSYLILRNAWVTICEHSVLPPAGIWNFPSGTLVLSWERHLSNNKRPSSGHCRSGRSLQG